MPGARKTAKLCAACVLFAAAFGLHAQSLPGAVPMPTPEIQYLNAQGQPLAGAFLCTFEAGTTTPQASYTDSTAGTPNTNPVVLDASGRASVWVGPQLYKFVLYVGGNGLCPGSGAVQWSQDNVGDNSFLLSDKLYILWQNLAAQTAGLFVTPEQYGAVGDCATDDKVAFNSMFAAAMAGKIPVMLGPKCYALSSGFQLNNGIIPKITGQGSLTTLHQTGISPYSPLLWIGPSIENGTPLPGYRGTVYTFTGDLMAGQQTYMLTTPVSGLVAGQEIFLALGQDPYDPNQHYIRQFARIQSVDAVANSVTLSQPLPENVSGTFVAGDVSTHELVLFTTLIEGTEISNFSIDASTGISTDCAIWLTRTRNIYVHDITFKNSNCPVAVGEDENITLKNLYEESVTPASSFIGTGIEAYGTRNLKASNIFIESDIGAPIFIENQMRGAVFDNVVIQAGATKTTAAYVTVIDGSQNVELDNFQVFGPDSGGSPARTLFITNENAGDVKTANWTITGAGVNYFPLDQHAGTLAYNGATYQLVKRYTITVPLAQSMNVGTTFALPSGLYRSFKVYVNSKTGIQEIAVSNTGQPSLPLLQTSSSTDYTPPAGTFGSLTSPFMTTLGGGFTWGLGTTGRTIEFQTDNTLPANDYVVVEIESFIPDDDGVSGAIQNYPGGIPVFGYDSLATPGIVPVVSSQGTLAGDGSSTAYIWSILGNVAGTPPTFSIENQTALSSRKEFDMQLDLTNSRGLIQALQQGVAEWPIYLTGELETGTYVSPGNGGVNFAALTPLTPNDGRLIYCTDCTASTNPCTGSGMGTLAMRANGAWRCL